MITRTLPHPTHVLQLVVGLLLIGCVYFLLPNRSFDFDSITYARDIEAGYLLHPHHVLHNLAGWVCWRSASAVAPVRSIYVLQWLNSLGALVGLAFFYGLARRCTSSHVLSLWATLVLGFSHTWWVYATTGETYILPLTAILGGVYACERVLPRLRLGWKPLLSFALGLPFATAALLHQTHVLFLPALVVWFLSQRAGYRNAITTAFSYAGVTFLGYLVAAHESTGAWGIGAMVSWALGYARNPAFAGVYGLPLSWSNIFEARRAWVSVITADGTPGVPAFLILEGLLVAYCLTRGMRDQDERRERMRLVLLATGGIVLFAMFGLEGLLAGSIVAGLLWSGARGLQRESLVPFLVAWLLPYAAFAFWWQPGDIEFLVPLAPALLLLVVCTLGPMLERQSPSRAWYAMGILTLLNAFGTNLDQRILPSHRAAGCTKTDSLILAVVGVDDVVVTPGGLSLYIPYFHGRPVISIEGAFWGRSFGVGNLREYLARLQRAIDGYLASGKTVYVLDYPFELGPPPARELAIRDCPVREMTLADIVRFYSRYDLEFIQRPEGTIARILH